MSSYPLVTIGICLKNNEKTVASTMDSVFKADYPRDKLEIIIVDGMSRDNTLDIVRKMSRNFEFLIQILHDDGKGLAYARQMVVDKADGKYIIWIDGDNVILPDFIKNHVEAMESNRNVGVAGSGFVPRGKSIVARLQGYQWLIPSLERIHADPYLGKMGAQGTICRTDAIRQVGGFDVAIMGAGEDVDLFVRIKAKGWKIAMNKQAIITHFMRETWRSLWNESCWWGYGTYYLASKHKDIFPALSRRAGSALLDCIRFSIKSVRTTKDPMCFLMPFHYFLRRLGFLVGHIRAHRNRYVAHAGK